MKIYFGLIVLLIWPLVAVGNGVNCSHGKFRKQAYIELIFSYRACTSAVHDFIYWQRMVECMENGDSVKEVIFCQEAASFAEVDRESLINCSAYRPSLEDISKHIEKLRREDENC